jgi:hypothetical protein
LALASERRSLSQAKSFVEFSAWLAAIGLNEFQLHFLRRAVKRDRAVTNVGAAILGWFIRPVQS